MINQDRGFGCIFLCLCVRQSLAYISCGSVLCPSVHYKSDHSLPALPSASNIGGKPEVNFPLFSTFHRSRWVHCIPSTCVHARPT
ncbi:hypothetical protein B0H11DRAFT_2037062 [Mycena galericulata]|nr:hypothetical protein B0H11DRAFT_2037062 [Mycena galericulata]